MKSRKENKKIILALRKVIKAEEINLAKIIVENEIEKIFRNERTLITAYDMDDNKFIADNDCYEIEVLEYRGKDTELKGLRGIIPVDDWIKSLKEIYSKGLIKKIDKYIWKIEYDITFKDRSVFRFDIRDNKIIDYENVGEGGLADELVKACDENRLELKDEDIKKLMEPDRDKNYEMPPINIRQKTFKGRF